MATTNPNTPVADLVLRAADCCAARGHGGLWPSKENCIVCGLASALERQERELIELRAVKMRAEARIDVLQEVIDEEEEYALKPGNARYDISNYERILHGGETKHGE